MSKLWKLVYGIHVNIQVGIRESVVALQLAYTHSRQALSEVVQAHVRYGT